MIAISLFKSNFPNFNPSMIIASQGQLDLIPGFMIAFADKFSSSLLFKCNIIARFFQLLLDFANHWFVKCNIYHRF